MGRSPWKQGLRPKRSIPSVTLRPDMTYSDIIGDIEQVETIARGRSIRERHRLAEQYGEHRRGQWRKMKGFALVRLPDDTIMRAEVHWYEANGIGRREFKVKRLLYPVV